MIERTEALACLTPREFEILALTIDGARSAKEVAAKLGSATKTVEAHFDRIKMKLQARSKLHAVLIALGRGAPQ
ncbi:helix-turn-helix transcriptional regulator [Xanthobacteraceae bacterium Astr-EGSB]|uniref:response regulator transcription factor n=1 Tax=Astrobacterium formosum TaxID=3069710 RepID=UPI0027B2896F|nr:helix-turn-helix transcriptional regulator [Xanthobacteraceae bacterium Astr-EGSB]